MSDAGRPAVTGRARCRCLFGSPPEWPDPQCPQHPRPLTRSELAAGQAGREAAPGHEPDCPWMDCENACTCPEIAGREAAARCFDCDHLASDHKVNGCSRTLATHPWPSPICPCRQRPEALTPPARKPSASPSASGT